MQPARRRSFDQMGTQILRQGGAGSAENKHVVSGSGWDCHAGDQEDCEQITRRHS